MWTLVCSSFYNITFFLLAKFYGLLEVKGITTSTSLFNPMARLIFKHIYLNVITVCS